MLSPAASSFQAPPCPRPPRAPDDYAAIARWYDPVTARFLRPLRRRMAAICAERGWRRVLDFGCGTGEQVAMLRDAGIMAAGMDTSPAMLSVAVTQHPALSGSLVRAGLPAPFRDASFDAVILSLVLHESREGGAMVLREALRLAPRALILEWRMPERNLDYPGQIVTHCVERLAGKGHYKRFRAFARAGWLRGLAYASGVPLAEEHMAGGGLLTLAIAGKIG